MMRSQHAQKNPVDPNEELLYLRLLKLKYELNWSDINHDQTASQLLDAWERHTQINAKQPMLTTARLASHLNDNPAFHTRAIMMLADGGHIEARYKLSLFHLRNHQIQEAVDLLTSLATHGHLRAQFDLAKLFDTGVEFLPPSIVQTKEWIQTLLRELQQAYFMACASNGNNESAAALEQLQQEIADFIRNKSYLAEFSEFELRKLPDLEYLASRNEVMLAVEALNELLDAYRSHVCNSEDRWIVANTHKDKSLRLDEYTHAPLRPMAVISFLLHPSICTVTDNPLFKLFMKMQVSYAGILEATAYKRTLVLSVNDALLLQNIPRLCSQFNIKKTSVITDYFQYPELNEPARPFRQTGILEKKKAYLLELKLEADKPTWNNMALKFYGYTTPEHITTLRSLLKPLLATTSDNHVDYLFRQVEELIRSIPEKKRDPQVDDFYSRIRSRISELNQSVSRQASLSVKSLQ